MKVSKYVVLPSLLLVLLASVSIAALAQDAGEAAADSGRSISASLWCDFAGPGRRGVCVASPSGSGNTYAFYTSGQVHVGGGLPTHHARSATCSGLGTVTVVVTNAAGASDSASFSTTCSGGR